MIQRTRPLKELLDDTEACRAAMQDSIDKDIERHRLLGHSIWVWRDGGVVEVPAEEITPLAELQKQRQKA
jgi:hypothetical protein